MITSRIPKGAESEFGLFKNSDTVTLVDGDVVMIDTAATTDLGFAVKKTTGAGEDLIVGVVSGKDIGVGETGRVQTYGYHATVKGVTAGTVGTHQVTSATAGTATDGGANIEPGQFIGMCVKTLAAGRTGIFIRNR